VLFPAGYMVAVWPRTGAEARVHRGLESPPSMYWIQVGLAHWSAFGPSMVSFVANASCRPWPVCTTMLVPIAAAVRSVVTDLQQQWCSPWLQKRPDLSAYYISLNTVSS